MVVKTDENNFLLIGTKCRVSFQPLGKDSTKAWQYLKVEEGLYSGGSIKPLRILNGDETDWGGPRFDSTPSVVRLSLILR